MGNFCQQGDITKIFIVDTGNTGSTGTDIYVTGGTYFNGTLTLGRNDGFNILIPGFLTGTTDTYITGGTYFDGTLILDRNDGISISVSGFSTTAVFTGNTSANCISDLYISNLHGCSPITVWDPINSLTSISATTYYGDGSNLTGILDYYVTGGTYSNGTLTLNRQNGSLTVGGFLTGTTDTFVTGFTLTNGNILTIFRNQGLPDLTVKMDNLILTGLTVNGSISASTYLNLPVDPDTFVTGVTYSNNNLTITRNQGQSPLVATIDNFTGLTINGSLSASTYLGLPIDPDNFVTGGTYSNGNLTLNRQNGSVMISGFLTGTTDTFVTGVTYSNNNLTITRNQGQPPLSVVINNFTGLTVNGSLSASTYLGLPIDPDSFVTGGTYSNGILTLNRQNGSVVISGFLSADTYVTGFTFNTGTYDLTILQNNGLPPLTQNLGILAGDVTVTGGTYNPSNGVATFFNNIGGSFQVSGFLTGFTDIYLSNGSYNPNTGNLTLTRTDNVSITVTGFTDYYVTGGTYSNGILTLNRQNGQVTIPGFFTGSTNVDTYVTGFTYNDANRLTISQNQGQPPLNVFINTFSGLTTDYVDINTGVTITSIPGRLAWNDVDGTVELGLKGGVVKTEIGQGLITRVVNKTAPNIDLLASNYQVVVVAGAQGQRLAVKLAQADNDANSAGTLGLIAENINKNQEGFIITVGLLKNINTTGNLQGETWNDGDILYLSPTTAGAITNIKPQAPQHTVIIGYVEYSHPNNGKIYVKIDNGYELDELHNVRITGVTNNQVLSYDSGQSVWVNRTLPNFITGFTDNFVTGGTYSSGTLTLNRQNGSVIITGFTTSSSSGGTGIDTYVTGFTYSNNNLSINQNQGQSPLIVTIDNFTGLTINGSLSASTYLGLPSFTFTGNTSASCINDIFVSNLHGCSPITIHDSIQSVGSIVTGITSFAFGSGVSALGGYSHAEGGNTQSIGPLSHAEGVNTQAIGEGSHAEGDSTQAIGNYSHAEGDSTQAIGGYSHAEGYLTKTIGGYSHTEGNGALTGQYFYTTIGVSSGVITLDGTYGDVSTEFTTTGIILENSGTFTWYELDSTNPPYFDGTNTIITLVDTSVNSGTNVGVPGVFQPTAADILLGSLYSHAEGEGTIAIGSGSHAEGSSTQTIGSGSHAEGLSTTAIGEASHAEGESTTSSGVSSHAEGGNTEAIGNYSHTEGVGTSASGTGSHTEGVGTSASGTGSHAEGEDTSASGRGSHAEGDGGKGGGKDIGSIGDWSHTEGRETTTNGDWSHAEGYLTITNVKGLYSHAEGHGSQAIEIGSHAEGYFTQANGDYSHSQGTNTITNGNYSFASGSGSTAQGALSFVHSINSVAAGEGTVVLGGVGISGTTPNMVYVSTLNINSTPVNDDALTQILVRDSSNGDVKYRDSSTLGGGSSYSIIKPFNNYVSSATTGEQIILCNTSGGTFNVTLPSSGNAKITVKKISGAPNLVINTSGGQTIDGASTATITVVNASITFITDGSDWFII